MPFTFWSTCFMTDSKDLAIVKASIAATNSHSSVLRHTNGCFAALHVMGDPIHVRTTPVKLLEPLGANELSEYATSSFEVDLKVKAKSRVC